MVLYGCRKKTKKTETCYLPNFNKSRKCFSFEKVRERKSTLLLTHCPQVQSLVRGTHSLSAGAARRTKSSRPEELPARRGPYFKFSRIIDY